MINPKFPTPCKSINHKNNIPIGLLKIGAWYKDKGYQVKLQQLSESEEVLDYDPDEIKITSVFTYWSEYVVEAVEYARENYPTATIEVGGVWASLMPDKCKELTQCDSVYVGVCEEAEQYRPDYSLLSEEIDFQIIHTSRGCHRRCKACGAYCIEPELKFKKSIRKEVIKKKLVFYDNNILLNPYIENILRELIVLRKKHIISSCESQSGFDGRLLRKKPYIAKMLYQAGFKFPKIAWDGSLKAWSNREKEIDILLDAGYEPKKIGVFFLENYDISYEELEHKRIKCWEKGVQVIQCRYRPLDQLYDYYNGRKKHQTSDDYYIHPNWTHQQIKRFNRNVKLHNTCIRFNTSFWARDIAYKKIPSEESAKLINLSYDEVTNYLDDVWNPASFTEVDE